MAVYERELRGLNYVEMESTFTVVDGLPKFNNNFDYTIVVLNPKKKVPSIIKCVKRWHHNMRKKTKGKTYKEKFILHVTGYDFETSHSILTNKYTLLFRKPSLDFVEGWMNLPKGEFLLPNGYGIKL